MKNVTFYNKNFQFHLSSLQENDTHGMWFVGLRKALIISQDEVYSALDTVNQILFLGFVQMPISPAKNNFNLNLPTATNFRKCEGKP